MSRWEPMGERECAAFVMEQKPFDETSAHRWILAMANETPIRWTDQQISSWDDPPNPRVLGELYEDAIARAAKLASALVLSESEKHKPLGLSWITALSSAGHYQRVADAIAREECTELAYFFAAGDGLGLSSAHRRCARVVEAFGVAHRV